MSTIVLKAHYDGEHIVLDEPCDLPPDTPVAVTVLDPEESAADRERDEWTSLGTQNLARAYGEDEPEYTLEDIQP